MTTIAQLKSALSGGGARPNLFEIQITLPNKNNKGIFSTKKQQALENQVNKAQGIISNFKTERSSEIASSVLVNYL